MNPFTHEKRRSMTPQRRARIFALANSRCSKCSRKLGPADDWDVDHKIALECGGTDDDANLQVLCDWCHDGKTGGDHEAAGKGRRRFTKHVVPKRFREGKGWRK